MKEALLETLQKQYDQGNFQSIVDTLLEMEPEKWGYDLTCLFARALNELGEYEDAVGYLLKVAKEGRKDYMWYVRMGYAYFLQKQYQRSSQMFQKALKLQPNNQEILLFAALASGAEKEENIHQHIKEMTAQLKKVGKEKEENMAQQMEEIIQKLPLQECILNIHTLLEGNLEGNVTFHIKKDLLKDWKGSRNCFATNRIIVDGEKIAFMYRDIPKKGQDDSGWRFTAGDESSSYMADEKNFGLYDLNLLCNYDPDIISFLNAPYGKAYYRDEQGVFQEAEPPKY